MVSLGCVMALFVKHVSTSFSGAIPMMVTFIPLVVHILLVRDIYVKWEDRWVGTALHRPSGRVGLFYMYLRPNHHRRFIHKPFSMWRFP